MVHSLTCLCAQYTLYHGTMSLQYQYKEYWQTDLCRPCDEVLLVYEAYSEHGRNVRKLLTICCSPSPPLFRHIATNVVGGLPKIKQRGNLNSGILYRSY